jgi:TIGR00159 family protein
MSAYNLSSLWDKFLTFSTTVIDIVVIWMIILAALRIVRGKSSTMQIFKGIIFVIIVDVLAKVMNLKTLQFLTNMFINWGFLAVIIIFQPEIRTILERLGKSSFFSRMSSLSGNEKEKLVDNIVTAVRLLSADQTGALISIEKSHPLDDFIATGTRLNSDVTAELLTSIFVTSTPLHDGAVIIQGDKIACASAYFPPTTADIPSRYGSRHRAAIGISEITDAITIVVSEETGNVSIAESGKLTAVNEQQLRKYLTHIIVGKTDENSEDDDDETMIEADVYELQTKMDDTPAANEETILETGKITAEEVVPAEQNGKSTNTKHALQDVHEAADAAAKAASIKLPHKKKRPTPSYPTHNKANYKQSDTSDHKQGGER